MKGIIALVNHFKRYWNYQLKSGVCGTMKNQHDWGRWRIKGLVNFIRAKN